MMPWSHMGEWMYSSTILDLGIRWRWMVSYTHSTSRPGRVLLYSLDKRLGGPQSQYGCYGIEKKSCSCQDLNFDHLTHSSVIKFFQDVLRTFICLSCLISLQGDISQFGCSFFQLEKFLYHMVLGIMIHLIVNVYNSLHGIQFAF
jgi:hypothetical protein